MISYTHSRVTRYSESGYVQDELEETEFSMETDDVSAICEAIGQIFGDGLWGMISGIATSTGLVQLPE